MSVNLPLRELVIELPMVGIVPSPVGGHQVGLYEHDWPNRLTQIMNVTRLSIHFVAGDITTADLEFDDGKRETWLVVGFRERS